MLNSLSYQWNYAGGVAASGGNETGTLLFFLFLAPAAEHCHAA